MRRIDRVLGFRVTRFALVGVCNTAINFLVLNLAFYGLHQSKLASSFIATSCAIAFSFVLNRNFVFVDKRRSARKLALFAAVTVSSALLIQNFVYSLGIAALHDHEQAIANLIHMISGLTLHSDFVAINLSNAVASLVVMIWNYNGYRLFVFRNERRRDEIIETEAA